MGAKSTVRSRKQLVTMYSFTYTGPLSRIKEYILDTFWIQIYSIMQSVPGSVIQKGRPKYEYFSGNFRLYSPLTLQIFLSLQSTHQPALQQQYTCLPFFGAWPSRPPSSLSGCCLYHKKWPSMLPSIQYNY